MFVINSFIVYNRVSNPVTTVLNPFMKCSSRNLRTPSLVTSTFLLRTNNFADADSRVKWHDKTSRTMFIIDERDATRYYNIYTFLRYVIWRSIGPSLPLES